MSGWSDAVHAIGSEPSITETESLPTITQPGEPVVIASLAQALKSDGVCGARMEIGQPSVDFR